MQKRKTGEHSLSCPFKVIFKAGPSTEEEKIAISQVPYSSAVGSLVFAMVSIRPDIARVVGAVGKYRANHGCDHWTAVK